MTSASAPDPSAEGGLRVVLVDDSELFRQGLGTLLAAAGLTVVADFSTADRLASAVEIHSPAAVVLDGRMPPTFTDEGIRAALDVRRRSPGVGVLVLSTYAEGSWAKRLFADGSRGMGYLLKDRVADTRTLIDAIRQVSRGGTVVDPEVIEDLFAARRDSAISRLTERERDVLALMAQGRSNVGIGRALNVSPRTVEAYIAAIFVKLPLDPADSTVNRRVLAVLQYLEDTSGN